MTVSRSSGTPSRLATNCFETNRSTTNRSNPRFNRSCVPNKKAFPWTS